MQIVTAELDTRAQEMAADEIQAKDTGFKGFNGPKGSKCFRATLGGFKCSRARARVCAQCLKCIPNPMCPECSVPVHTDCYSPPKGPFCSRCGRFRGTASVMDGALGVASR